MKVLAFDPGFERLGIAVVEKQKGTDALLYSDCIRTPASLPFSERLLQLGSEVEKIIKKFKPNAVALEEVFFAKNEKTAMKIAEVRGALSYIARSHGLQYFEYTPAEVKIAITGYGRSDKSAILAMVRRLVRLPEKKRLDDEVDAIAVGLTCLASERISTHTK